MHPMSKSFMTSYCFLQFLGDIPLKDSFYFLKLVNIMNLIKKMIMQKQELGHIVPYNLKQKVLQSKQERITLYRGAIYCFI